MKWLFSILSFLTVVPLFPKIITTATIDEVTPLIDKETWFLVDLDNTLFEAKQALGHAS